jgi:hypothetical protein
MNKSALCAISLAVSLTGCSTLSSLTSNLTSHVTSLFSRKAPATTQSAAASPVADASTPTRTLPPAKAKAPEPRYAIIQDTTAADTQTRAQFFVLAKINGTNVDNALVAARRASKDGGYVLPEYPFLRTVPIKQITVTLQARLAYSARIYEEVDAINFHAADRNLSFTPKPDTTYLVKGTLTTDREDVWLEEADTGKVVQFSRVPSWISNPDGGGFKWPDWLKPSNWW